MGLNFLLTSRFFPPATWEATVSNGSSRKGQYANDKTFTKSTFRPPTPPQPSPSQGREQIEPASTLTLARTLHRRKSRPLGDHSHK